MLTHASAAKQSAPAGQDHARETAKPASRRSQVAVRSILRRNSLQRAIKIGRADDAHEREAERVAAQVVEMPAPGPVSGAESETNNAGARNSAAASRIVALAEGEPLALQRAPAEESLDEERPGEHLIQFALRSAAAAPPDELPPDDPRLRRLFGGGQPLPTALRADMEGRFGEDFGAVRIHTDAQSAELAAELNARAFTLGQHVAFAEGGFRPDSREGRKLLAHELTHVVQQQGHRPSEAVQQAAPTQIQRQDEEEDLGFFAEQAMRLVRRYAPRLVPIFRLGPLGWLKQELGKAFDGIAAVINRLNPGQYLDQLTETFTGLMERASTIVTALISGDCQPLFDALNQLKTFVTEVAGAAWNKLSDFLSPIGDFFTDLWDSVGAPAIEWLQQFAGDLWQDIEDLAGYIWDQTEPVRDLAGLAWDWVKEQLFGPAEDDSDGDSRGGIIGWFTDKATQAWDWVKERTRPVWEPVAAAAETIQEMIPPQFVAELGESMQTFSQDLTQTTGQLEGGASVAENREALAGILPSVKDIIALIRGRIVAAQLWLVTTVVSLSTRFTTFMSRLRANSVVSLLASGLAWLESAAGGLMTWASQKIAGLFNSLLQGFDFLSPFVEKIIDTVANVITVMGDLLQLPQLVLSSIWSLIPECIREPIKDFLFDQILSRIPVFNQLLAIRDLWNRVQETALQVLRALFVDGDLPRAAWTFFSSMLRLIGLPPELVVQVLAKAAAAIGDILSDPIGFLINTLKAIKEGFSLFFSNILRHLLTGVSGWLFGHMRDAGITPPTDFSLGSILGLIMQILDITVERVLERLALQIGPENVERLRRALRMASGVWAWVRILIEEGPGGLWREVQERLSNLWNMVLDSVIGWVTQTIVTRVTVRLLTMLDPSGIMAVVNSVIALYRAIQSFVRYLREMLEIVNKVLDGIGGIARGAIELAAGFLEGALGRAIPIAIGFLANQVGLGNLSTRIREFVEGVRERVDGAIDWLIERALAGGRAFLDMLRRGAEAVSGAIVQIRDWWRARKTFNDDSGAEHSLYFTGSGRAARLMIASDPQPYRDFIHGVDVPADKQSDKQEALGIAEELDQAVQTAANAPASGAAASGSGGGPGGAATGDGESGGAAPGTDHSTIIQDLLNRLGAVTARFMPAGGDGPSTLPEYGSTVDGYGSSVRVARLTQQVPPGGGAPSVSSPEWEILSGRWDGSQHYYVRGHLLNGDLGGPGTTWANLTPLTQRANLLGSNSHFRRFEDPVKRAIDQGKVLDFECTATYGRSLQDSDYFSNQGNAYDDTVVDIIREEQKVPQSLSCSAHQLAADGQWDSSGNAFSISASIDNSIDPPSGDVGYQLTREAPAPRTRVYLNELLDNSAMTDHQIAQRLNGIDPTTVQTLRQSAPFFRYQAVEQAVGAATWQQMRDTPGIHLRLYRRS